ncbi:hypothetical protein [Paracoccus salsus]|nr:hypothetical protein [Paracoccus salsus]
MPTLFGRRLICKVGLARIETYCEMTGLSGRSPMSASVRAG